MKTNLIAVIVLTATALIAGCSHQSKEEPAAASVEKSAESESRVKRGTNGEIVITLDAETQKVMGLQTAVLVATQLQPEIKGFGRVLDPTALSAMVAELVSVRATADASQKDLARLKTLTEQNNASARALEAAEAAARRDAAQAAAARARLLAATGKAIAEREDLSAFAQSLASGENALVRIDLPAGEILTSEPTGARLVTLAESKQPIEAKFVGAAPAVDPQMQGQGFLFLVTDNPSWLVPGAAITGFLKVPGESQPGTMVPREAVLRFNGTTWVYLQTGEETFQRTEAALERPLENGWFVREGFKPQDKVVLVGAQQLLSEELKGQIGGE